MVTGSAWDRPLQNWKHPFHSNNENHKPTQLNYSILNSSGSFTGAFLIPRPTGMVPILLSIAMDKIEPLINTC